MLIPVLTTVVVVIVLFGLIVMLQPNDLRVSRSRAMNASPEKVFEQVNDFHKSVQWNPWVKLDPNLKQTCSGSEAGIGAIYEWDGNSNVGTGRQTIIESCPHTFVRIKLEFFRPFVGINDVTFTCEPQGNQTLVTWCMTGKINLICRAMGLFISMEKMCGNSFSQGLADMQAIVETSPSV